MMGRLRQLRGKSYRLSEAKSLKISLFGMDQYYPFGMRMGGLSYQAGTENRYRYNGKEFHQELNLGLYDYGFRWYDPAVARFVSVDPLAESFPHNATYAYAENRPIDGIDLDGLEFFSVHGVQSSPKGFEDIPKNGKMPEFLEYLKENVSNSKEMNNDFSWKKSRTRRNGKKGFGKRNDLFFNKKDRKQSAKELVEFVLSNRDENDEITLAGFSGGALVSILAADMLGEQGIKVNVIAVNPPAMKDPDSPEHPSSNKGINDMLIIHTDGDPVPGAMRGAKGSYEDGTINPEYQQVRMKSTKKAVGAHMVKNVDMESVKNEIWNV